ncbi:MAG: hypothetical protein ACJA04_000237 [Cellvibrionaceae bacterium]|jgi:hypothetical protein
MLRMLNLTLLGIFLLMLSGCEKLDDGTSKEKPQKSFAEQQKAIVLESASEQRLPADKTALTILPASAFKTVEWTDLMPKEDLDALLNPPSYVTDVEDGSFEDQISSQIQNSIAAASDDRYQQALASTRIIPEMDGQAIRVPGFIVPLEFDDEQTITQFFLVPFFGACIHLPPPPPNQVIFVNYPKGIKLDNLYDPLWISGILKTSLVENNTAIAAYSMQMQSFKAYTE